MQCKATARNGKQCKTDAIKGATVCRMHGGSAPQVREAAALRILGMVDPALATLAHAVKKTKALPTAVAIMAARDILDRAGLGAPQPQAVAASATINLVVMDAGQESKPALKLNGHPAINATIVES